MRSTIAYRTGRFAGILATAVALAVVAVPAQGQAATKIELELKRWAEAHREEQAATLEQLVNIQSGTLNVAGVRAVGAVVRKMLDHISTGLVGLAWSIAGRERLSQTVVDTP